MNRFCWVFVSVFVFLCASSSAGLSDDGSAVFDSESCQGPISCPPGEINITDIELGTTCTSLYSAAGNNVRTWDLRM